MRGGLLLLVLSVAAAFVAVRVGAQDVAPAAPSFDSFLAQLWPDAQARGVSRAVFDKAFAGLTPDPRVIAATQKQPEYGKPVGAYVNAIASNERVEAGRRRARAIAGTLDAVERTYGVDRWIIVAVWGIETSYGIDKDRFDVIRSLATLAQAGYRDPYFRNELLVALAILQEGSVPRERLVGAWAGAMGQPQFMPSNYLDYAVKFSGEGRGDIWTDPADVVASIGNYLKQEKWAPSLPWGLEIRIPNDFDYRRPSVATFREWSALGIKAADSRPMPKEGDGILFFPTGASGPAFLVTNNFNVIKQYNDSDVYALAVGILADRLRGLGSVRSQWPTDDRQLSRDDRITLQRKLSRIGYTVHDFQGHIDFALRDSIREVQSKLGMVPDGHPTPALLDRLDEVNR